MLWKNVQCKVVTVQWADVEISDELGNWIIIYEGEIALHWLTGADSLTKAIEHTGQTYDGIGTLYSEQVVHSFSD